jgi:hypothetical protein
MVVVAEGDRAGSVVGASRVAVVVGRTFFLAAVRAARDEKGDEKERAEAHPAMVAALARSSAPAARRSTAPRHAEQVAAGLVLGATRGSN